MSILKKIKWFHVITFLISLSLYVIPSLIFRINQDYYNSLNGPKLPPAVFIIMWSIIYILISIFNTYYISLYRSTKDKKLIKLFVFIFINYLFNISYIPIFNLEELFLAFVICLVIFITLCFVMLESLLYNKKITYLNIIYLIWSVIAIILSIMFYINN